MSDQRPRSQGDDEAREAKPVPKDMPHQQAGADGDPWEPDGVSPRSAEDEAEAEAEAEDETPDLGLPDTDEAGTGRRGSPHSGSPRPEHPVPDESPG